MQKPTDAEFGKRLETVESAERKLIQTQAAFDEAKAVLELAKKTHTDAKAAALQLLRQVDGLVLHDGKAWRIDGLSNLVSQPIGRDLSPHQESFLPRTASAA